MVGGLQVVSNTVVSSTDHVLHSHRAQVWPQEAIVFIAPLTFLVVVTVSMPMVKPQESYERRTNKGCGPQAG